MYSKMVMEHFNNPRNAGVIEDADGIRGGSLDAGHQPLSGKGRINLSGRNFLSFKGKKLIQ